MPTRLLSILVLVAACGRGDKSPPGPTPTPSSGSGAVTDAEGSRTSVGHVGTLNAPASVRSSSELAAELTITNPGPADLTLRRGGLELSMLAVEVRDVAGHRVNPMPPPVPRPTDAALITLHAGESRVQHYPLNIYAPELPPGTYTLHCLVVTCAPVTFAVAPQGTGP